jgi:hypothetical protein
MPRPYQASACKLAVYKKHMDSTALALTLIAFGVALIVLSYQRHHHHRNLSALGHGIAGALLFLSGTVLFALGLNFNTYDKLTPDQALAELSIEETGPQIFQVRLMRIPAGDLQVFTLKGDRWQMQAQLLHWQGWARWLGLDANIRLEELSSSQETPAKPDKNAPPATAGNRYQLSHSPGISIWDLKQQYAERLPIIDPVALQTELYPLEGGKRFHIELVNGELTARVVNQPPSARTLNAPQRNAPVVNYRGVSSLLSSSAASDQTAGETPTPQAQPAATGTPAPVPGG